MPTSLNCQHFKNGGFCTHHAAPRQWFGLPPCVEMHPPADVRLVGCALIPPHARPDGYPSPPPPLVTQTTRGRGLAREAPICSWCDQQRWDVCQHADDARACVANDEYR